MFRKQNFAPKKNFAPFDQRGLTAVELTVAAAVFTLLALAIAEMTAAVIRFNTREGAAADVERRTAGGIELIREAAKGASAVLASATVNGTPFTSGTSTVVFSLPAINAAGALLSGADLIGFRRDPGDNTILLEEIEAATSSVRRTGRYTIASFVDVFRIRYNTSTPANSTLVEIYLETKEIAGNAAIRSALSTQSKLENR
ncbi:hypothetical protein EPN90_04270 [Patescibacteria group bacterium]|nr:MAG: hypothetical protein EPN90_04270 [Patescibacteria group bacterium]